MNDKDFERRLKGMFTEPAVPESLSPDSVAERLKEVKPRITLSPAKIMSIAAALLIVVFSSVYFSGAFMMKSNAAPESAETGAMYAFDAEKTDTDGKSYDSADGADTAKNETALPPNVSDSAANGSLTDALDNGQEANREADPRDLDGDGVVTDEEIEEYEKENGVTS